MWSSVVAPPQSLLDASGAGIFFAWHCEQLWDLNTRDNFPIQTYHEHQAEVSGVHWNLRNKDMFVSASWDKTIKVWKPEVPRAVATFAEHTYCVYTAIWRQVVCWLWPCKVRW